MGIFDSFKTFKNGMDEVRNENLDFEIAKKKAELAQLNAQIAIANDELGMQEFGFFQKQYKFSDSTQYKQKLADLRATQKLLVKNGEAGIITQALSYNNSVKQGETMQKQLVKALIRSFNGEADAILVKVTPANIEKKQQALWRSCEQLNKIYKRNFVAITQRYYELKAQELQLSVEYDLEKEREKQLLREQREKEREEKKLQQEIAKQRKQIEKDKTHYSQMVDNVQSMIQSAADSELEELKKQLAEYQSKIEELEATEKDIDYREGHATAGYVYVISNIGAFGPDVYKIGVTRRLDPMERIKELGSASVPFHFDVHALVFSENAFALETELHNELAQFKVNKVNNRKEYFKVAFWQIKEVLDRHPELAVELTETAEAFEYRQSQAQESK